MLRFFRKIRKPLIKSLPARRYILYTIGEISLVVIGILIALQVNNWNESRKSQLRLLSHYSDIKEEINYNLEMLAKHMIQFDVLDSSALYIRSFLDDKLEQPDTAKLKRCFLRAGFYGVFGITRDSYDNLVSSGDVNLIKNIPLQRKLSNLYAKDGWSQSAQKGLVIRAIEDYDEYKHNFIDPMMMRVFFHNGVFIGYHSDEYERLNATIDDYKIDWHSVKKDKEYSVRLDRLHIVRLNQRNYYLILKKLMITLLDDLSLELFK